MNWMEKFETKEELLQTLEAMIEQDEDGLFSLGGFSERKERLIAEIEQSKKYRHRAQEAESRIAELETELATNVTAFEELKRMTPDDLQAKLIELTQDKAELLVESQQLRAQLEPLQEENESLKSQWMEESIKEALVESATRLGVRPEAMRDVQRLAPLFEIDEEGNILTAAGETIDEVVQREKMLSPHWLPPSQGGGSRPGNLAINDYALFRTGRRANSVETMIINSPLID